MRTSNRIYAIYDRKAKDTIGAPFLYRADAAAIRGFKELLTTNNYFKTHPEDYDLILLGTLTCDDSYAAPELVAEATGAEYSQILISAGATVAQEELPLQIAK